VETSASDDAIFTHRAIGARRIDRLTNDLGLDRARFVAWAFAQAVLSVLWLVEDRIAVAHDHPWLTLAECLAPMMKE